MEEIWKDIEDYEGYYQASNLGRVKSLDRTVLHKRCGTQFVKGRIMVLCNDKMGYFHCLLQKDGHRITRKIHRLIAQSFIPNPENKHQVNHKNGIKTDNRVDNLEWATSSENSIHAYANNLMNKNFGVKNGSSKLNETQVLEIKQLISENLSCYSIAKKYSVSFSQIERIKNKKNWAWLSN